MNCFCKLNSFMPGENTSQWKRSRLRCCDSIEDVLSMEKVVHDHQFCVLLNSWMAEYSLLPNLTWSGSIHMVNSWMDVPFVQPLFTNTYFDVQQKSSLNSWIDVLHVPIVLELDARKSFTKSFKFIINRSQQMSFFGLRAPLCPAPV